MSVFRQPQGPQTAATELDNYGERMARYEMRSVQKHRGLPHKIESRDLSSPVVLCQISEAAAKEPECEQIQVLYTAGSEGMRRQEFVESQRVVL